MKTLRISLITFTLLGLAAVAIGQQPTPVLVDEYSNRPTCDDFIARLDGFLGEMRLLPDWKGVIVLRDTPSRRVQSATLQSMIEAWLNYREFDLRRVEFVRADADEPSRQFWRVPPRAPNPSVERIVSGFQMSEAITEPFLLADESPTHICPEIEELRIFADFLQDNPEARGNIVVRDRSIWVAKKRAAEILKELESTYKIPHRRLRTFTVKPEKHANRDEAIVEYWYLP